MRAGSGTTSAYAENTQHHATADQCDWNYLRVRGEYGSPSTPYMMILELPPRTRRIPLPTDFLGRSRGTTSAYAENTPFRTIRTPPTSELPPRTRRIPERKNHAYHQAGTTSAYAENTGPIYPPGFWSRNYLRVRGEYHGKNLSVVVSDGTTSAYAENTFDHNRVVVYIGNYLRVRGEYPTNLSVQAFHLELPPRTRRIPPLPVYSLPLPGTTSAYAENTTP